MKINGRESPLVDFGDGSIQFLENVKITAYSTVEDWFMGIQVFTHVYATPTNQGAPWTVSFKGCCRLSNLEDKGDRDSSWTLTTFINLLQADKSPRIVSLPIIFLRAGQPANFTLQTAGALSAVSSPVLWGAAVTPAGVAVDSNGLVRTSGLSCDVSKVWCLWRLTVTASPDAAAAAAGGGPQASMELLLNVTQPQPASDPIFASPAAGDPAWTLVLYAGFPSSISVSAYMAGGAAGAYVGFTSGPLPAGARLSTVRGKGAGPAAPASITLSWLPTTAQVGDHAVCLDAVNSAGTAATQRCLALRVRPDPPPAVSFRFGGADLAPADHPPAACRAARCFLVLLYMGRQYDLVVAAADGNGGDALRLDPTPARDNACNASCPLLPPGAMLSPTAAGPAPAGGGVGVTRTLTYAPAYDDGGYLMQHCFQATDSCGAGGGCGPVNHTAVECVWVQVTRCQFVVREGQQLQEIAAIYATDWLQLWSLNPDILHPDMDLVQGAPLHLGHEYQVQPLEKGADVAARMGMDPSAMLALNADLRWHPQGLAWVPCMSVTACQNLWWCVIPNSCSGASGSMYAAAAASSGSSA